ncbi:MAG: hypothetical protein MJZ20_11685 [Bacteroidaceae bacterium]|nr:hypothetical protein [Bacteroidaceae bacterium]
MTKDEREFLNDVKDAVSDYDYSYEYYHENGDFCVDITIDDMDEWGDNADDIWNDLEEVADDWGAGIDSDMNCYYLALEQD